MDSLTPSEQITALTAQVEQQARTHKAQSLHISRQARVNEQQAARVETLQGMVTWLQARVAVLESPERFFKDEQS